MKTLRYLFLCCGLLLSMANGLAQNSGTCGENLTWTFDSSTGTLMISGAGSMTDYTFYYSTPSPWYSYRELIIQVEIKDGVTGIGSSAFVDCSGLTSVTIPNSVTSIGNSAFSGCSGLTSITIPNNVTNIGDGAFSGCTGLLSVYFNAENCTYMGSGSPYYNGFVFDRCISLNTVYVGDNVKTIPDYAFSLCTGLTSVTILNVVTSIGRWTFWGCTGLSSVTIPNCVTSIGEGAFYGCVGLTSITISNNVTSIGDKAFSGCSGLTSVVIPGSVTSIGNEVFYYCSGLTSVTIPNSVTSIGEFTFSGCSSLTSVTIPNSVTSIRYCAFSGCTGLTSVTCYTLEPPALNYMAFNEVNTETCILYVLPGKRELYAAAYGWKDFNMIIEMGTDIFALVNNFDFMSVGGTTPVTIFSKVNWTATVSDEWLTLNITGGSAGYTIATLTAAKNTSPEIRSATITLRGEGVENFEIKVVQAGDEILRVNGEPKMNTLARGEQKLYRLPLFDNQTIRIADSKSVADIAVAYEQLPDITGTKQGSFYISNSIQGDYYVLVSNNGLNALQNQPYSITAQTIDMEIANVFTDTILRHGSALIPIEIIGCEEMPQVALVGKDGKRYEAENVQALSETLFSAQFRVDSLNVGSYAINVSSGSKSDTKENSIYLKDEAIRESLKTKIILPSTSRIGNTITAYVEYVNTGNVDIPAPLLILTGTQGSTYQIGDGNVYSEEIHLMGLNAMGVLNRLRPGEGGRIEVKIGIPNQQIRTADYNLRVLSHSAEGMDAPFYLQWLNVDPAIKPNIYTQEEWEGYTSRLRGLTGETWNSFVDGLNVVEGYLMDNDIATVDAREVYKFMKEMAFQNESVTPENKSIFRAFRPREDVEPGTIFIWESGDWKQMVEYSSGKFNRIGEVCKLFKEGKQTFFVSHGWNDDRYGDPTTRTGMADIARALSKRFSNDCNIITVDWSRWSNTGKWIPSMKYNLPWLTVPSVGPFTKIPLVGPAINAGYKIPEVAGRIYSNMCIALNRIWGRLEYDNKLHLIGHSHGAHVCGMLAENFKISGNIADRLSCLDASNSLSHINWDNFGGKSWGKEKKSAKYIDYYKSSILCGTESLKGDDNFILIKNDDGFNFNPVYDGDRHSYAIEWYIKTIDPGYKQSLGFNSNASTLNSLWGNGGKPQNQWHGVINGMRDDIECLSIRDKLGIEPSKWRYTAPWYEGEKATIYFDDTVFRDAFAGTFEFAVDSLTSITLPKERLVAGTSHFITLSYSNRADNFTVDPQLIYQTFFRNSGNALFVSKDSILDVNDYSIGEDKQFASPQSELIPYDMKVNFSQDLWKYLGGDENTKSIDCYLIYATGIKYPQLVTGRTLSPPKLTNQQLTSFWQGELYPNNNITHKKITIYNPDLWCYAGGNQTLTFKKDETVCQVEFKGEAKSFIFSEPTYKWYYQGKIIATQKSFVHEFPVGIHEIKLESTGLNLFSTETATDYATITVKPYTPGDDGGSSSTSTLISWDPNEKVGIKGAGDNDCVLPGNSMDYTIFFENDSKTANAPAQVVRVTDVLDEAFDLSTFSFTGARVANEDISVQNGVARVTTVTDLRPDNNLLLRTTLDMDIDTRTITATFTSLDPETNEFPTDPSAGFLFPNDDTHRGEGRFSYRVALKGDLPDGYSINNQANIYFDKNEPIATNVTSHIIDLAAPSSNVYGLPASTGEDSVLVSWKGSDAGSGVRYYDIYSSDNGGNYIPWQAKTMKTSAYFQGEAEHTYSFFSVATDWIGHMEAMKNQAEATILFQPKNNNQVATPIASIPSGSTVAKNTAIMLSSATEGAAIHYTTDGSAPSGSNGMLYIQPIVITDDVTIQAMATKAGMSDSKIAIFKYTIDTESSLDPTRPPVILYVHNQTLFIKGLKPGESYTIYSVLGTVVTGGKIKDAGEHPIPLPYKGTFVVSTPTIKAKIVVK